MMTKMTTIIKVNHSSTATVVMQGKYQNEFNVKLTQSDYEDSASGGRRDHLKRLPRVLR